MIGEQWLLQQKLEGAQKEEHAFLGVSEFECTSTQSRVMYLKNKYSVFHIVLQAHLLYYFCLYPRDTFRFFPLGFLHSEYLNFFFYICLS